jgi:glucose/mannose-6-phosphate isomerase
MAHKLDDLEEIKRIDTSNMLGFIGNFPRQIEEAIQITENIEIEDFNPSQIVIAGVGGSAIGGDILASWLFKRIKIPIFVNRAYKLPTFVDENTLLFAVSYSGNTEETLSLFEEGIKKGCRIVAITSGGKLKEHCEQENVKIICIPKGVPPRAAVAYLFIPIVGIIKKLRERLIPENPKDDNPAKQLALQLHGETPIIYGFGIFNPIARRWQTQLNENAKVLAWHGSFPEMNHNEMEAWAHDYDPKRFTVVLLRDDFLLENRLQKRVKLTKDTIFKNYAKNVIEVVAEGGMEKDYLSRMLYSVYLGDFVSIYLAILRDIDPTPVLAIEGFKRDLAGN